MKKLTPRSGERRLGREAKPPTVLQLSDPWPVFVRGGASQSSAQILIALSKRLRWAPIPCRWRRMNFHDSWKVRRRNGKPLPQGQEKNRPHLTSAGGAPIVAPQ